MKHILIVEDDMVSRKFLSKFLSRYGDCDLVVDGLEAIDAYLMATKEDSPYDLICLDVMMPKIDGIKVLKTIRDLEKQNDLAENERSKIIMTTVLPGFPATHNETGGRISIAAYSSFCFSRISPTLTA